MTATHSRKPDLFRAQNEREAATSQEETRERFRRRATGQDRPGGPQPQEEVGEETEDGRGDEKVSPECVDLDLEEVRLVVRGHSCARDADDERGEGVEAPQRARGLWDLLARAPVSLDCRLREEPAHEAGFETHSDESGEPEPKGSQASNVARVSKHREFTSPRQGNAHDSNADVLNLLGGVWAARFGAKALHPGIGDAVQEDQGALDHLRGGGLAAADGTRETIPGPAKIGKSTEIASKGEDTVQEEYATLCMRRVSVRVLEQE